MALTVTLFSITATLVAVGTPLLQVEAFSHGPFTMLFVEVSPSVATLPGRAGVGDIGSFTPADSVRALRSDTPLELPELEVELPLDEPELLPELEPEPEPLPLDELVLLPEELPELDELVLLPELDVELLLPEELPEDELLPTVPLADLRAAICMVQPLVAVAVAV